MAMEVVMQQHNTDFDFNKCPSPLRYISAPSSPAPFGEFYHSAPTSPTRLSAFYRVEMGSDYSSSPATVPFDWEEKPGTPKSYNKCADEFAFDVSEKMETASLSAEELFDSGVIRPIKPPPRLQHLENHYLENPARSPIKASTRKSMEEGGRGRERNATLYPSSSRHRATRSLSPLRVSEYLWEEENRKNNNKQSCVGSKPTLTITTTSALSSKSYKKWSLKDLFLFRSASEGRAADKYPLKKYAALFKEVNKQSSFRSVDSTSLKRRGPVSAHELHYTMNRAVSEDLKKKTFLPYKQGILGRLSFNPAVHAIANGFGFSRR